MSLDGSICVACAYDLFVNQISFVTRSLLVRYSQLSSFFKFPDTWYLELFGDLQSS